MRSSRVKAFFLTCLLSLLDLQLLPAQTAAPIAHNGFQRYDSLAIKDAKGVSLCDFDRDGLLDLFVAARGGGHRLLRNLGDFHFADVTEGSGIDSAAAGVLGVWADVDNDGLPDLFTASPQACQLFHNSEQGTFQDMSSIANGFGQQHVMAALWSDVDRDGFLDLYLACFDAQNALYRNRDGAAFENVIGYSGANDVYEKAMGGAFADYDNDGDPDLYLVHDNFQPAALYQNRGNGTFRNRAGQAGVDYTGHGMAPVFGDFDNDGFLDIYVTNLDSNFIFFNNGDGTFTNTTGPSGVGDRGMGWGVSAFDYDNDGWLDLYVANASSFPPGADNVLYRNLGNRHFAVVTEQAGVSSWGEGHGCASGDLNNDGFVDLVVTNDQGSNGVEIFINRGGDGHYLEVELEGTRSNRSAIGARVEVFTGGLRQMREVSGGSGWLSQDSPVLHFGLGQHSQIDSIRVRWPSGDSMHLASMTADQRLYIKEETVTGIAPAPGAAIPGTFRLLGVTPNPFAPATKHQSLAVVFEVAATNGSRIEAAIYDILGRKIKSYGTRTYLPGRQRITWAGLSDTGSRVPNGFYFIRISDRRQSFIQKIVVMQ